MIIKVVEKNVDGCGSDAEVLLSSDRDLTPNELGELFIMISQIKSEWDPEDWDTDSMVEEAVTLFNRNTNHPKLEISSFATIEF